MSEEKTKVATRNESSAIVSSIVLRGDLSQLSPEQKVQYYREFCASLDLNPLTLPFNLLKLNGKEVLYANKNCGEQLRKNNGVSVLDIRQEIKNDIMIVTVKVQDRSGRTDVETGAVSINGLKNENLANAIMKVVTKAKRRATLSICSIGILDESELDTVPDAQSIPLNGLVEEVTQDKKQDPDKMRKEIFALITRIPEPIREPMKAAVNDSDNDALSDLLDQARQIKTRCQAGLKNVPAAMRQKAIDALNKVENLEELDGWESYIADLTESQENQS